jgi:hypothetical protein
MMARPVVSVVAVRDGSAYVCRAIESILLQTLRDFEFVIVDDGSSDRTPQTLASLASRDPRLRIVDAAAAGLVRALSTGCALATAPYASSTAVCSRSRLATSGLAEHELSLVSGIYRDVARL